MKIAKPYRPVVRAKKGRYKGAALVGINSVILGWNVDQAKIPKDLVGFSVRRTDFDPNTSEILEVNWLNGQKRFRSDNNDLGIDVSSDQAPFQRFRWSDYTLNQGHSYRYDVFPMRGKPGAHTRDTPLTFDLQPSPHILDDTGIFVNRGVTAAMAYLQRFNGRHPNDIPDGSAYRWLERGMRQSLLDLIASAKIGESLHVCIYEFFDKEIAKALKVAKRRKVKLQIVYHAKAGDHATEKNLRLIEQTRIISSTTPRTNTGNISHNKFVIHLTKSGKSKQVWTASANFSPNAFYFQTNVALIFKNPELASAYEDYFQILRNDPKRGRKKAGETYIQDDIDTLHKRINNTPPTPITRILYSPIRGLHVVEEAIDLIDKTKSALFLSAPFGIGKEVIGAIGANKADIIEYGLANSTAKKKIEGLRRHNTRFFTPSRLKTYMGQKWDAKAFGAHKIHSKTLVIDPWGENPAVLFGSANFSKGSCKQNDENTLLIRGDKRFAAIITTEFLRMYDHYKIRYWINKMEKSGNLNDLFLKEKQKDWLDIYFRQTKQSRKFRDRVVFSGGE